MINADNVVLNCNGHSITGLSNHSQASTYGIGINGKRNIEIRNCKLDNFKFGLSVYDLNDSRILNNEVTNSEFAMYINKLNNVVVDSNEFSYNTNYAIHVNPGNKVNVTNNFLHDNRKYGIYLRAAPNSFVDNNEIIGGGTAIFVRVNSDNSVITNNIARNAASIYLAESPNSIVSYNENYNSSRGYNIIRSPSSIVEHNIVEISASMGFYIQEAPNSKFNYNVVKDVGMYAGIYAEKSNGSTFNGNFVENTVRAAIEILNSQNSTIIDNHVHKGGQSGIHVSQGDNYIIKNNLVNNSVNNGIRLRESNNNIVEGNYVLDQKWGISITGATNIIVRNNTALNGTYGIYISGGSHTIDNNYLFDLTYAMNLALISDSEILSNTVHSSYNGIYMGGSSLRNTISDNEAYNNTVNGIYVGSGSLNNSVMNNTAYNNHNGIFISYSNYTTVTGNDVRENERGINVYQANSNIFNDNVIEYNNQGTWVEFSSANLYYNNYFNGNIINAIADSNTNNWNIPITLGTNIVGGPYLGGNYWSDYTGVDNDGDALGNTFIPHTSSGNIQNGGDNLPLTELSPCNIAITNDTVLTRDYSCSGTAFKIDASNITLDCNNHVIFGDGTGRGIEVILSNNIEIKNCEINNFGYGILFSKSNDSLIHNNEIHSISTNGIHLNMGSTGNIIENNEVYGASSMGIHTGLSDNNIVRNNIVHDTGNYCIDIRSNNNEVYNNTLYSCTRGIELYQANNTKIHHNTISNISNQGIYSFQSDYSDIYSNTVFDSHSCIGASTGTALKLHDNIVNNCVTGYGITSSPNAIIINNLVSNGGVGFSHYHSSNILVENNIITNVSNTGLGATNTNGSVYRGNIINGQPTYGYLLEKSSNLLVENNYAYGTGFPIRLVSDSTIINNHAENSSTAFQLSGRNNYLANNNASGCTTCLSVYDLNNSIIENNNMELGQFCMGISGSYFNVINNNNLINCSNSGIRVTGYNYYNNFTFNTISGHSTALHLQYSENNIFHSNYITDNNMGMIMQFSDDNLVYNNYFDNINNLNDPSNNSYNIPKTLGTNILGGHYLGGNYWNDYTGIDVDGDLLGDTSVPFEGDYHPLTYQLYEITFDTVLGADLKVAENGLTIAADNIILDCNGYSIVGSGLYFGITANNRNNITIENCTLINFTTGISLANTHSSNLISNILSDNSDGIKLENSNQNTLTDNTALDNARGIFAHNSDYNTLNENAVSDNTNGIYLSNAIGNTVSENSLSLNYNNIYLFRSTETLVEDNLISSLLGNSKGIYLSESDLNTITENTVSDSTNGIFISTSTENTAYKNSISNNQYGVYALDSANNLIYDNYLANVNNAWENLENQWNIEKTLATNIMGEKFTAGNYWSDYPGEDYTGDAIGDTELPYTIGLITGDTLPLADKALYEITENTVLTEDIKRPYNGLVITSDYITLDCNNHIIEGTGSYSGIIANYRTGITIKNCIIRNFTNAIQMDNTYGSRATKNELHDSSKGITMTDSSANTLDQNTIQNNARGIFLYISEDNDIQANTITNSLDGIHASGASYNRISDNILDLNYNAIYLYNSPKNDVERNIISGNMGNTKGLYLNGADYNAITHNTITHTTTAIFISSEDINTVESNILTDNQFGLYVLNDGNLVTNNYFSNTFNAWTNASVTYNLGILAGTNIIGGPSLGGNYWSDYGGVDLDNDGFGDSPYTRPNLGTDSLPLLIDDYDLDTTEFPLDTCPSLYNPDLLDSDNDGFGDVCDICPLDSTNRCLDRESNAVNIDETGGTLLTESGNVEIYVPLDALAGDTSVSITGSHETEETDTASFTVETNLDATSVIYSFGPENSTFSTPLTITMTYNDTDVNESTVDILYYNPDTGLWEPQGAECNTETNVCTLEISHFSDFLVAAEDFPDVPPILDAIGPKTTDENSLLTFTIFGTDDNEEDTVSFEIETTLPSSYSFDGTTGEFSWTPTYDDSGAYQVKFIATDGNLTDNETITITVNHVNRPVTMDLIGDKSVDENSLLTFTVSGTDPDVEDTLTYSTDAVLPSPFTFDTNTGEFDWTPTYDDSGSYEVTFTTTDGEFEDSETITITVNHVNRAPIINPTNDKIVDENVELSFTVSGTDLDVEDTVSYSTDASLILPSSFSFDLITGEFSWTPSYDDSGTYDVTFTISDGLLTHSDIVRITVNHVNRPPVLNPVGDKSVDENTLLDFWVAGYDPDDDYVSFSIDTILPSHYTFDVFGHFTWTPDYLDAGNYTVKFNISDGEFVDSETIVISVIPIDVDNDGIKDLLDNCPLIPNPLQEDCNNNSIGDACDGINPLEKDMICDGIDNNCNGYIDEDYTTNETCGVGVCEADNVCINGVESCTPNPAQTFYLDNDSDSYGNLLVFDLTCEPDTGYIVDNTDCNDEDNTINPGAADICDINHIVVDKNCNILDDTNLNCDDLCGDADSDGYVTEEKWNDWSGYIPETLCPWIVDHGDCNDAIDTIYPNAIDPWGDGIDQNCDEISCGVKNNYVSGKCGEDYVTVSNDAELAAYLADYSLEDGEFKNLKIEYDISMTNIDIHSPCEIKMQKGTTFTGDTICIDARDGIKEIQEAQITANEIALLSELGKVKVGEKSSIYADYLIINAYKEIKIGKEANLEIDGDAVLQSTNSKGKVKIEKKSTLIANNLDLISGKETTLGEETTININGLFKMISSDNDKSGKVKIKKDSDIDANVFDVQGLKEAKIEGKSVVNVTGNFNMQSEKCHIDKKAIIEAGSTSGNCFEDNSDDVEDDNHDEDG